MRTLFVGSSGGHLAQMLAVRQAFGGTARWVTFETPDATSKLEGETVIYGHYPTTRNLTNLLRNTLQAVGVVREFRPDVIMSTGAGVAVPYFVLARILGIRTVYLEVVDRIASRTLTGRLVLPFTDDFLVQWPRQLELYPDAKLIGPVI